MVRAHAVYAELFGNGEVVEVFNLPDADHQACVLNFLDVRSVELLVVADCNLRCPRVFRLFYKLFCGEFAFFGVGDNQERFVLRIFFLEVFDDCGLKACYENVFVVKPRLFAGGFDLVGKSVAICLDFKLERLVFGDNGEYFVDCRNFAVCEAFVEFLRVGELACADFFDGQLIRFLVDSPIALQFRATVHADHSSVFCDVEVCFNHSCAEVEGKRYAFCGVLRREERLAPVCVNVDCLRGECASREQNRACGGYDCCM